MTPGYKPSPDLTFYMMPSSTASVTEAVLLELGLNPTVQKMTLGEQGTGSEEFKKTVNPNGLVPVIKHEGAIIWESSAITMYLGEVFGVEKSLWPPIGPQRGEAMKWVVWTGYGLHTFTGITFIEILVG
jgi:glutathione S-transferase